MKTLICGTGVRGALVGAALIENGAEVAFACRPTRQRQLIGRGLEITSPLGHFRKPVHAPPVTLIDGPFDVVVVATRANVYSLTLFHFRKLLTPDTLRPAWSPGHLLQQPRHPAPRARAARAGRPAVIADHTRSRG